MTPKDTRPTPRTRFVKGSVENDLYGFSERAESNAVVFKSHVMRMLDRAEALETLVAELAEYAQHKPSCWTLVGKATETDTVIGGQRLCMVSTGECDCDLDKVLARVKGET